MNTTRWLGGFVAVVLLAGLASGCRKHKPVSAPAPESQAAATVAEAPAPAPAPPPANLPTGAGTTLAPSAAGDPDKETVKTQDRFNRNSIWMAKLGRNDPQLRAQVLGEIQRAGLSPAELHELRRQAQMYGIKL